MVLVNSIIFRDARGSSAAVCSSRRSNVGRLKTAMRMVKACRCPPERRPTLALILSSSPSPRSASRSWISFRSCFPKAGPSPLNRPRRACQCEVLFYRQPGRRPHQRILKHTANQPGPPMFRNLGEISFPISMIFPLLTKYVPATRLSSVDLPEPFPPIMVRN